MSAFLGCAIIARMGHKGTNTINPGVVLLSGSVPSRSSGFVFSGPVFGLICVWLDGMIIPSYPLLCLFWIPPTLCISQGLIAYMYI